MAIEFKPTSKAESCGKSKQGSKRHNRRITQKTGAGTAIIHPCEISCKIKEMW